MTAVEWLIDTLRRDGLHIPKIYESVAEQKEKQQIIDFTNSFINEHTFGDYDGNVQINKTVEYYYNETFKKL
jgi:heterodisulfide reductase subunit B